MSIFPEFKFAFFKHSHYLKSFDSKLQASKFGDISRALKEGIITKDTLIELGAVLQSGISEDIKTIIADFSGIGAQDVAMAELVLHIELYKTLSQTV